MTALNHWDDNATQFLRLLAEIHAVGLTDAQCRDLCASMDIHPHELASLLERAEAAWEEVKAALAPSS